MYSVHIRVFTVHLRVRYEHDDTSKSSSSLRVTVKDERLASSARVRNVSVQSDLDAGR
jgi:D-alanine-D-alanine ligase-like ATP-grasp enzyme